MKHLFILNSASIKNSKKREQLLSRIKEKCQNLDYEIYLSGSAQDAKEKAIHDAQIEEELCIYIGGGDGSIHQIVEAVYRFSNVLFSAIPTGTGNDFIRSFGSKKDFLTLSHITNGEIKAIDLIRANHLICTNMINIGFDESVVRKVSELRRLPFMTSAIAYTIGVLIQLIRFPHETLTLCFDDGSEYIGKCLLTYIANGQYCGGGYRAASLAQLDDGKMDTLTVYPVSRRTFLSLIGAYKKGTLLTNSQKMKRIAQFRQVQQMTISKKEPFYACLDGEILSLNQLNLQILPRAIRFKYPKTSR